MYHYQCDWCGESINTDREQYVKASVSIVTLEKHSYRDERVKETEPTRFFHVSPLRSREEWNRLGLDIEVRSDDLGDCCYTRALRAIEGHDFDEPDAGHEWRLVPVGATVVENSGGEADAPAPDVGVLAEPLWMDDEIPARGGGTHQFRIFNRALFARGLELTECPGSFNIVRLKHVYETVGDLQRAIEDGTLLEVEGVGPKTFRWIKEAVAAFLAEDGPTSRPRRAAARGA